MSVRSSEYTAVTVEFRQPCLRLKFCPLALRLDKFAESCGRHTIAGKILHHGARLLAMLLGDKIVEVSVEETLQKPTSAISSRAISLHDWLLMGNSIVTDLTMALLLTWRFSELREKFRMMDIYNILKRCSPDCYLTVEESMLLPMAYARYKDEVYIPPLNLITIN